VRISYLLGNLTKSFNYRAVASNDEKTLTLSEYIRIQNLANESFGSTGLWAGFGPRFLKPIGINETKEMLIEKYQQVPVRKTYTADPQQYGYLDRPQNKLLIPMHYMLKNDKTSQLGRAPLQYGKVRIFQEDGHGGTAFLGEDWGKFTPLDEEMRLYVGTAQDVVVKRTIDKNEQKRVAGNLYNRQIVVKYEIENFKDKAVTLDISENIRALRNEVAGDTRRDVQWELGEGTTLPGKPDKEKSTFEQVVFHFDLPARGADQKAVKTVHKLDVLIKAVVTISSIPPLHKDNRHEDHRHIRNPGARPCGQSLGSGHNAEQRRSFHGPFSGYRAAYDLQLRGPDLGSGDPERQFQERHQSPSIQLGQYAHRPDLGAAAVRHPRRKAGVARHDLPALQAADALLERPERDGWGGDRRDHLLHQRDKLDRRLPLRCQSR
jgi:hypothetical protein